VTTSPGGVPIRVLVAERETKVRDALAALVSSEEGFALVGVGADAHEAVALAAAHQPDVAVVDVEIVKASGIRVVNQLLGRSPGTKIIAMSGFADREYVLAMIEAGAAGYMVKSAALDLLAGIRAAHCGEVTLSFRTAEAVPGPRADAPTPRYGSARPAHPGDGDEAGAAAIANLQPPAGDVGLPTSEHLRKIIDERLFHIAFQPIIDLPRHTVVAVEALARFSPDPLLTPDLWFTRASALGCELALDLASLSMAVDAATLCPPDILLAINLSPGAITSRRLARRVAEVAPSRPLVLEVSDRALVHDLGPLVEGVARLRECGARIAIDDAGTGTHDFGAYARLKPDLVKIDASVVARVAEEGVHRSIAQRIVAVAGELGAGVVGEGIETPAQLEYLMALGVRFGQGHLLGRPGPLPLDPRVTMA
jgi:EAL domain-containing protein (putative c-di-GMP-specific phosphodiesterase class I)/ActR/RegA family two-component response regulator